MSTVTEEAQAKLRQLIENLRPGEEIVITWDQRPVAKLVGAQPVTRKQRRLGIAQDEIVHIADDFGEPLEDFRKYME